MSTLETVQATILPGQATDLAHLVDLEARWENLRIYQPIPPGTTPTLKELHQRQKAHEAFFAKMSAYNKRYRPVHVPEQLLNNAARLGAWCRSIRDLYLQTQNDIPAPCPLHVLEKAYRWADRVANRMKKEWLTRPAPSTVPAAIQALDDLAVWCDGLAPLAVA